MNGNSKPTKYRVLAHVQRLQGENAGLQQALEATQEVLRQRQEEEEVQPVGLAAAFDAASRSGGHESREAATMGSKPSPRREAGRAHGDRQSERDQQGGTQQQGQQQQQVGGEQERELQRQLAAAREQVSSLEEQVVSLRSKLDEYRGFTADNQQEIEELQAGGGPKSNIPVLYGCPTPGGHTQIHV